MPHGRKRVRATLLSVLFLIAFAARAAWLYGDYEHPDEPITVGVVNSMRESRDWDTDWAKADVPPLWRHHQYNFSSYMYGTLLFDCAVRQLPGTDDYLAARHGLLVYRLLSLLLAMAAIAASWRIAVRVGGTTVGMVGLALGAIAPLLVQDAHYARPEAFCTALMQWVILLLLPGAAWRGLGVAVAAAVLGLLVACKVSILALAWLPVVTLWSARRTQGIAWRWFVLVPCVLLLGFVVGVPGVMHSPGAFFEGVSALRHQYSCEHPPHGHPGAKVTFDLIASYFGATLGWPALSFAAIGTGWLWRHGRLAELALLAGPVVVMVVLFGMHSVFFERNLSHVLPSALVLAAIGAVPSARWLGARAWPPLRWALPLAVAVVTAWRPVSVTWRLVVDGFSQRAAARENAMDVAVAAAHPDLQLVTTSLMSIEPLADLAEQLQRDRRPVLLCVLDAGDEWTAAFADQLVARSDARLVAESPGLFPDVPTCTLHTYLSAGRRWYVVSRPR